MRLKFCSFAFLAISVVPTQVSAQAPETLGRPVTLPGARCDTTTRQPTHSTVSPIQDGDVLPRLLSDVIPIPPAAVKHTGARTVLELVVDSTGSTSHHRSVDPGKERASQAGRQPASLDSPPRRQTRAGQSAQSSGIWAWVGLGDDRLWLPNGPRLSCGRPARRRKAVGRSPCPARGTTLRFP